MQRSDTSAGGGLARTSIASVRSRVANGYLIGFCVLAGPGLAASLARIGDIGWLPIMGFHIAVAVSIFTVTLLRHRLPYKFRAGYIVGMVGLLGVASVFTFGLASGAPMFFLSASIIAFLLFGALGGWTTAGASGLVLAAGYIAFRAGLINFAFDHAVYATALSTWITQGVGLGLLVSAIGVGVMAFNRQLADAWHRAERERTELALLSDHLKAARDEAIAASHAKSEFIANASHELRTPLNAIIGFSEYLMIFGDKATAERRSEYLRDIHGSGKLLLAIVNDLLDLSRVEANQLKLEEEDFDLIELVNEAVRVSRPLASGANVRVSVVGPMTPITVHADRRVLHQVLFNLLSNAIKFNRNPGSAEIRVGRRPDSGVEILVSDTGIGVDPAIIPELFQPFRQANSEIARDFGGTGLGLSIVKRLVGLHGGEVAMHSEPGHGTTVCVTLPASRLVKPSEGAMAGPPKVKAEASLPTAKLA